MIIPPDLTQLEAPQDILEVYWNRAVSSVVQFGDVVVERYGQHNDKYALYIVDAMKDDIDNFQGGDIRVVARLGETS